MQSGTLYFQEEISYKNENKENKSFDSILDSEIVIPDFSEEENKNEPYALNSDIKP